MNGEVLYVKLDKNIQVPDGSVTLGDLAEIRCSAKEIERQVKLLPFPTEEIHGPGRYVYSVLDLITVIQKEYPDLTVSSLGESDFILTVEKRTQPSSAWGWCKTALVCLLAFFGAAFSIMAFNNDVGITTLFAQLYETFTGQPSDGFTVLEVSYSVGVGLGILIFFHHFARKKDGSDPTPLQVEMRTYEDDIDATMIESGGRRAKHAEGDT
jgi:stage V sporulation protein AA